jgi:hypothetical protein
MVEMRWLVLMLKLSQVTDVAEKENQEPMADQVITVELSWVYVFLLSVVQI